MLARFSIRVSLCFATYCVVHIYIALPKLFEVPTPALAFWIIFAVAYNLLLLIVTLILRVLTSQELCFIALVQLAFFVAIRA